MKSIIAAAILLLAPAFADTPISCDAKGIVTPKAANSHLAENYPPVSVALGEQGTTTLRFVITAEGTAKDVVVVKSSGSMRLDEAAIEDISNRWRYTPARSGDQAISCMHDAEVRWALDNKQEAIPEELLSSAIKMARDDYPEGALSRHEQGMVVLLVICFDKDRRTLIARSSGFPELDKAAQHIVNERLRLEGGRLGENPVQTTAIVPVLWTLDDAK
jgi:TonB family protein